MRWWGWRCLQASPAFAHAFLERATAGRQRGRRLAAELTLTFTEGVEPLFSTIEVRGPNGAAMPGQAACRAGHDRQLIVDAADAAAGALYGGLARDLGRYPQDRGQIQFTVTH